MAKTAFGEVVSSLLSDRKTAAPGAGMRLHISEAMPASFLLPGRKTESSTAGRVEKGFWVVMIGVCGGWALYALLPALFALF